MMYLESFPLLDEIAAYLRSQIGQVAEPHPIAATIGLVSWATGGRYLVRNPSSTRNQDERVKPEDVRQSVRLLGTQSIERGCGELVEAAKRVARAVDPKPFRLISGLTWFEESHPHQRPLSEGTNYALCQMGPVTGFCEDEIFVEYLGEVLFVEAQTFQANQNFNEAPPPTKLVRHLRRIRRQKMDILVNWTPDALELMRSMFLGSATDVYSLVTARRVRNVAALVAIALNPDNPVIKTDIIVAATEPAIVSYQFVSEMFVGESPYPSARGT